MTPRLSLVLPAYESAGFVASSVKEVLAFLDRHGIDGEVVVVDDGSRDGTADAVPPAERVRVLRQRVNAGKGAALRVGMLAARGRVRAFTDADLPYGTEPLLSALGYIEARRYHAVIGDRTLPGSTYAHAGAVRGLVSSLASVGFRTLVTGGVYDTQCGFKAFRDDVARELFGLATIDGFAIDVELIYLMLKYRLDIKRLPVRLRRNASSSVRVVRDSIRASRDVARMRRNWALGRYRSPALERRLGDDLETDRAEFLLRDPPGVTGDR